MARLYADENFPLPVVEELRRLGHNVQTMQEAGWAGQRVPDEGVLEHAFLAAHAVLTLNRRDFIRLHQLDPHHLGLMVCSFDPDFVALARRIDAAIQEHGDLQGQLIRINRPPR